MNVKLDTELRLLRLKDLTEEQIKGIIDNFESVLNTDYIDKNKIHVAETFVALVEHIQRKYQIISEIPESFRNSIIKIFRNIHNIAGTADEIDAQNGEIVLMKFLSHLWIHNSIQGDGDLSNNHDIDGILGSVTDDLEKMAFLFDMESDGKYYFPIDRMLVGVIHDSNFLNKGRLQTKDYYALKLAVRFFKKGSASENDLHMLIGDCNLKFIEYLNPDSRLIDTKTMLNYKKNEVMVFWNSKSNKVLIRHNRKGYFIEDILEQIGGGIVDETTIDKKTIIGSYVEFNANQLDKVINHEKLLADVAGRKRLLELFFCGYKNIFLPDALKESEEGEISPINPFTGNDGYVIKDEDAFCLADSLKAFDEYTNLSLLQSRKCVLDRVSMGAYLRLMSINPDRWEDLLKEYSEDGFYQWQMVHRWLDISDRPLADLGKLAVPLYKELQYCTVDKKASGESVSGVRNYEISRQSFFPLKEDYHVLLSYFHTDFSGGDTEIVRGVIRDSVDVVLIDDTSPKKISLEQIEDDEGIVDTIADGNVYLVENAGKMYVYDQDVLKAIWGLKELFEMCLDYETASAVTVVRYEKVVSAMKLHKEGLSEAASQVYPVCIEGIDCFEDQAYYRILHNMIRYGIKTDSVDDYFSVFEGHGILEFSDITKDEYFQLADEGTLYVPKDAYAADGVLASVFDHYITARSTRNAVHLYDPVIGLGNDGKYTRKGKKINKIVFLFDNFEGGTATIRCISAYLDIPSTDDGPKVEKARQRTVAFHLNEDNQMPVRLKDVLSENGCEMEVHAFYGTGEAVTQIDDFLEKNGIKHRKSTYFHEIAAKMEKIDPQIRKIFVGQKVESGKYAVIREFNMTKVNAFPNEMISNPQKAITLFIKKPEKKFFFRNSNNKIVLDKLNAVIRGLFLDDMGIELEKGGISEVLNHIKNVYDYAFFTILINKMNRGALNLEDDDAMGALVDFAIFAFVKFFVEYGVGDSDRLDKTALYLISTLPPWVRVKVWEDLIETDHSLIVIEKLSKAYAKNGQMDLLKERMDSWIKAGYIDEEMASQLICASELLHAYRPKFPIADDMGKAKDNFMIAMKAVNAEYDVFLSIFEMLYGIRVEDSFSVHRVKGRNYVDVCKYD